jgi:hypothetical protein
MVMMCPRCGLNVGNPDKPMRSMRGEVFCVCDDCYKKHCDNLIKKGVDNYEDKLKGGDNEQTTTETI